MKKIYFLISIWMLPLYLFAAEPTVPGSNFSTGNVEGNSIYIYSTRGNGTGRIAIIKKGSPVTARPQNGNSYLANSTFGSGQEIAPGEFVVYSTTGTGGSFGVSNLVPDTEYFIAFFEVNGSGLNSEFLTTSFLSESVFTLSKPTVQPTNFSASGTTGNDMTISWEAGDGMNRIVLVKRGAPVNANPVELTAYRAHSRVEYRGSNSGTIIGDNNFVVYKGSGSSVDLTEMFPDTTYHFAIFEYNGSGGPVYLTTNPLRGTAKTLPQPTIASSAIVVSQLEGNQFSLRWTPGNGTNRIVVIREGAPIEAMPQRNVSYVANAYWDRAGEIAPGHKVIYNNSGNSCSVYDLTLGTTYYIAIFEYSGAGTFVGYQTSEFAAISQMTQPIPNVNVTNIDTMYLIHNWATLSFTPGDGTGRLVVMRQDSAVSFVPANYKSYNAKSFGTGTNLGDDNYAVYSGTDTDFSTYLDPGTKYYVAAFEFNGKNGPVYNISNVDTFSFTTKLPPPPKTASRKLLFSGIEGNSLRLSWTKGDGERRIVIVRKEEAVTAVPQNGVQYTTANKAFTIAPEIEAGQRVVYDGTGSNAEIDSLEIDTWYYVQVIEYNGTGDLASYLVSDVLSGYGKTAHTPTRSSSEVHFKLLTLDKLRILWTMGNGGKRIILGRKNAPVDGIPEDLKTYNASSYFGSGSKIGESGESTVVYSHDVYGRFGDQVLDTIYTDVTRMEPGNTYYFKVFEYNGVSGPVYKQTDPGEGSFTITFEPPTPATEFRSTSSDGNTLALHWTVGGGDKRIIIAREGQPVDVVPEDGVDYAENKDFRLAAEVAPGQRVVYDASSYSMNPEGLNPSTQYFFKIFEYGGTGSEIDYLTSVHDSTSAFTKFPPTIQASNVVVSGITPESGNVSWTNGDGERRIVVAKKGSPVNIDPKDTTAYSFNYFGRGSHLGDGNYVVHKDTKNNFPMPRLESGTTYYLAVYEANGNTAPVLLRPGATGQFTTLGPPSVNAVVIPATEITHNSFHMNFNVGSGQKRLILVREANPVSAEPIDNKKYVDNTYLGAGNDLGTGNFVVYDGDENNVIITGLKAATDYYFTIFEYNAFSGGTILNYLRPSSATGMVTTLGALPVKWLEFTGTIKNNNVTLKWATAFEQNNNHFIIERSVNGIDFSPIGKVLSKGNATTKQSYSFDHPATENILSNLSQVFYRIRQVDLDGRSTLSPAISIHLTKKDNILVYPNPVTKGSLPGVFINAGQKVRAQLYNTSGQLLWEQQLINGYNILEIKKRTPGLHLLKVIFSDGAIQTFKVLIE